MRVFIISLIIVAAIIGFLLFISGSYSRNENSSLTAQEFIQKASIINQFAVESGSLIQVRSEDPEVKFFAQRLITDYTNMSHDLESAIESARLMPSLKEKAFDRKHRRILEKLHSANESLDKQYMEAQVKEHDYAIRLFREYSQNGTNQILKEFANKNLALLEEHIEEANKLKSYM